jgi:rRNA maturation protein Nop10
MASFEDYELVWYALDAECVSCGNLVVVPCPPDNPDFQA